MEIIKNILKDLDVTPIPIIKHRDLLTRTTNEEFTKELPRGCACDLNGEKHIEMIFYDEEAPLWERFHIFAHEIGHLLFGHLRVSDKTRSMDAEYNEQEAMMFSAVFTALALYDKYKTV